LSKINIFFGHLFEFREAIIKSLIIFLFIFVALSLFSNNIYEFFSEPLLNQLINKNGTVISTKLTATFIVPLKITAICSFIASLPFIFYQLWKFVSPGLYNKERKLFGYLLISGFWLFILGVIFVYLIIFPVIFKFFISMTPNNVDLMIDISYYLDMIMSLFLAFGFAFQIPIFVFSSIRFKWVKLEFYNKNRPYIIVLAFIFGAIFTPPDIISQILLALAVLILYETGLILSKKIMN
jgi:sec-independent protein translocase protein TatC